MKAHVVMVLVVALSAACGGKSGDDANAVDGGGDATSGDGTLCCPPSASPACCMAYGGAAQSAGCLQVCDGMASPSDPGWHLGTDSSGCAVWIPPPNPTSVCGQVNVCSPDLDAGFTPAPMHPPRVIKGACTAQQVDDYFKSCLTPSGNCATFTNANATCVSCLTSKDSDPTWGPAVTQTGNGGLFFNAAGCIAVLTGDSSPSSCAQGMQEGSECAQASCEQCATGAVALQQCVDEATSTVCASWSTPCDTDAGYYSECVLLGEDNAEESWNVISTVMCGP